MYKELWAVETVGWNDICPLDNGNCSDVGDHLCPNIFFNETLVTCLKLTIQSSVCIFVGYAEN